MAANPHIRTIAAEKSVWKSLADQPLVLRAQVRVWTATTTTEYLSIRVAGSSDVAQLPKNVDFVLDGVDLSQIEIQGNESYRVTIIGYSR